MSSGDTLPAPNEGGEDLVSGLRAARVKAEALQARGTDLNGRIDDHWRKLEQAGHSAAPESGDPYAPPHRL